MAQLFAASRGHSHYYASLASHPGPIHPSITLASSSLSCQGFILQIKLLTMLLGPRDRLLVLMSVKGGAIPGDWPAHVARHHKYIRVTEDRRTPSSAGGENIPLSVLTRGIEQTQHTKACQLKQFSTRLGWDEFLSIRNLVKFVK